MLYGLYQAVLEKKQRERAMKIGEGGEKEEEVEEEQLEKEAVAEVSKVLGKRIRFISTGSCFFSLPFLELF